MVEKANESGLYGMLRHILVETHNLFLRFNKTTLLVTAIITVAAMPHIPKLNSLISLHDIIDEDLPSAQRFKEAKESFLTGNTALTVIQYKEGVSDNDLKVMRSFVDEQKLGNWELLSTRSIFDARRLHREDHTSWFLPVSGDDASRLEGFEGSPWQGLLIDKSRKNIAIEFNFKDTEEPTKYGSFDPKPVGFLYQAIANKFPDNTSQLVGGAPFAYFVLQGIRQNGQLNLFGLVLLLVFFWLLLRTLRSGLLLILTLVIASIWILGGLAYVGVPMDILLSGVILMILLASLEDYLYLSFVRQSEDWEEAFRRLIVPSFLTSLTTCVGFGSLYFTDLEIIQKFGLVCAAGAMIEWGLMFLFLPALLKTFPFLASNGMRDHWRTAWMKKLRYTGIPKPFAFALLLAFPVGYFGVHNMNMKDSPLRLFPPGHKFREDVQAVKASFDWMGELSVVFPKATPERIKRVIATIRNDQNIVKILDPYSILDFVSGGPDDPFRKNAEIDLRSSSLYKTFYGKNDEVRLRVFLRDVQLDKLNQTLAGIQEACGEQCHTTGELVSYAEFNNNVPQALFSSLTISLALVGAIILILALATRKRQLVPLLLASFWGPFCLLSIVWALQIPVNFLICVFACVLVGMTGDNAIQFLCEKETDLKKSIQTYAPSALVIAIASALFSLIFVFSYFHSSRIFGVLLAGGFISSIIGDVWLLNAFLLQSKTSQSA